MQICILCAVSALLHYLLSSSTIVGSGDETMLKEFSGIVCDFAVSLMALMDDGRKNTRCITSRGHTRKIIITRPVSVLIDPRFGCTYRIRIASNIV